MESGNLPTTELYKFNSGPSQWPDFIEKFWKHVHFKTTFSDNQRKQRLFKGPIYWLEWDFMHVLKALKKEVLEILVVSYLKFITFLDMPQLPTLNRSAIQHLVATIIWLNSMEYHSAIRSTEKLTKAVTHLPNRLYNMF